MGSIRKYEARAIVVAIGLVVAVLAYLVAQGSTAAGAGGEASGERSGRLAAEAEIARADLVEEMEAALGGAFSGVWFEASTAQLHVGVTSTESRRAAAVVAAQAGLAANVTETPVDSTWAELLAAQRRLSRHLDDLFARAEVATALRPELNAVEVELGSAVTPARRAGLEGEAAATGVDVLVTVAPSPQIRIGKEARCNKFEEDKAFCDPTIVAGVRVEAETVCTAGPAVMPRDHTKSTDTYILIAGHCIDEGSGGGGVGEKWFAKNKAGEKKEVGKAIEFLNGKAADVGVVKVDNPGFWAKEGLTPVDPAIAPWNEEEPEPKAVKGEEAPAVGTKVCMSAQTTGTACGKILKLNVEAAGTEGLVEVESAHAAGDSGAPWYLEAAVGTVEGTHVGFKGENAVFEPIATSFAKLTTQLKLLTEANKVRHAFKFKAEAAPATLTGKNHAGPSLFFSTAGALECNESTYTGTLAAEEATELELAPAYAGCSLMGIPATVDVNGCKYRFTVTNIESGKREGSMDIVCPEGKTITVTAVQAGTPKCTIHIPSQNDRRPVTYTNTGAGATREITIDLNVGAIKYTHTAGTGPGACAFGGAENGFLAGPISITGENAGGTHIGIFTS
jgi:hypothetical protein